MMDSADMARIGAWSEERQKLMRIELPKWIQMNLEKSTKFFNFSATDKYYKMQLYILKLM